MSTLPTRLRFALSGIIAGVASTIAFTWMHQILISDIWFSFVPMAIAGAVCGGALGTAFALLDGPPSARRWIAFNGAYVVLFVVLGITSVLVFEPIMTAAAVMAADAPPTELFERSLPFMGIYTVVSTAAMAAMFGHRPRQIAALLLTTTVLMAALGMNVGIFGLVELPTSVRPLIGLLFLLILVLAAAYVTGVMVLERKSLFAIAAD